MQEELRSYYDIRIQDMEAAFEKEINLLKEKYEKEMSDLVHAKLNETTTSISNASVDSVDEQTLAQADVLVHVKNLEAELANKDVVLKELRTQLDIEISQSCSLNRDITDLRQKAEDLQQRASEALSQCCHLQELLLEKDSVIRQLELEKRESEKLYRDLLEKESSVVSFISGSSVDASTFSSRVDSDIPHDSEGYQQSVSDVHDGNNKNNNASDLSSSVQVANDSPEYALNNNNCSSESLENLVEGLNEQVERLEQQLRVAREKEADLLNQIEEKEHIHKELLEVTTSFQAQLQFCVVSSILYNISSKYVFRLHNFCKISYVFFKILTVLFFSMTCISAGCSFIFHKSIMYMLCKFSFSHKFYF